MNATDKESVYKSIDVYRVWYLKTCPCIGRVYISLFYAYFATGTSDRNTNFKIIKCLHCFSFCRIGLMQITGDENAFAEKNNWTN